MSRRLRVESRGAVRVLTLDRPEARNAFDARLYRELREALAAAKADDGVRVVIVTGAGSAFTAGQDLAEMAVPPQSKEEAAAPPPFAECMAELVDFDKPLLAAVNGVGVGLGLTILLHCDVVHVARGAALRVPFVSLGVVPEAASSYLLPLVVGAQRAAEVLFTGDWVSSREAVEMGLALRELPGEELLPRTLALAERIAEHPLGALRDTKRLLRAPHREEIRAARAREDEVFARRIGSPENVEAIRKFFAERRRA